MLIPVSIDVYKIKDRNKWIVSFCKRASYFCGSEKDNYIGKSKKEAIIFNDVTEANNFATERYEKMNIHKNKFKISLNLYGEKK